MAACSKCHKKCVALDSRSHGAPGGKRFCRCPACHGSHLKRYAEQRRRQLKANQRKAARRKRHEQAA